MARNTLFGLQVVSLVAEQPEPVSIKELASATGIPLTTMYRIVQELAEDGWIVPVGSPRRYAPSLRVVQLGLSCPNVMRLRDKLVPNAIELARSTRYPCSIGFYETGTAMYTDTVEVLGDRIIPRVNGKRTPAHTTASGKILLAYQDQDEIANVIACGLMPYTRLTQTDPIEFADDIKACRERGYALNYGEFELESRGIAVPVFDRTGNVVAALGLGQLRELDDAFIAEILGLASLIATKASEELGYHRIKAAAIS